MCSRFAHVQPWNCQHWPAGGGLHFLYCRQPVEDTSHSLLQAAEHADSAVTVLLLTLDELADQALQLEQSVVLRRLLQARVHMSGHGRREKFNILDGRLEPA